MATRALHIKSDSLLLVQQMNGNYRVKHEGLLPLYRQARHLVARVGDVTFEHVRREQNKDADRLSNLGMDQNGKLAPARIEHGATNSRGASESPRRASCRSTSSNARCLAPGV